MMDFLFNTILEFVLALMAVLMIISLMRLKGGLGGAVLRLGILLILLGLLLLASLIDGFIWLLSRMFGW